MSGLLDMLVPSIEQAQGIGHKHAYIGRRSTHYYYAIANKTFEVNRRAYTVLLEGIDYCVYSYLPRTSTRRSTRREDASWSSSCATCTRCTAI